jgi:hypothetical protein
MCRCHVFIVITTAIVLKNDLSWEVIGVDFYDYMLLFSFIVLVPGAAVVAVVSKLRYVQKLVSMDGRTDDVLEKRRLSFDLQALGLATDADRVDIKRYIEGWSVTKKYAAFLSHFKTEAAAEARVLKLELVRSLRTKEEQVFLDADNLTDLRDLLDCVRESDALILMYTKNVLSRPWCLLELATAVEANVPIILLRIANAFGGDTDLIPAILDDLPAHLAKNNPRADETLQAFGMDAGSVGQQIKAALTVGDEIISFDPHQSSVILQSQIGQLGSALVEKACPENRSLLHDMKPPEANPWPVVLKYAVYIIHEEHHPTTVQQAENIKTWLVENTDLVDAQVVLQIDTENNRNRKINDVGESDMKSVGHETDCVLLLQSSKVMLEPRCLAKLFVATSKDLPIVPVVLMKSKAEHDSLMYDFATAQPMMEDLAAHLDDEAAAAVATATGKPINEVGLALSMVLPNIISKPLGLEVAAGETNAQMAEIERTLRHSVSVNVEQKSAGSPGVHAKDEPLLLPHVAATDLEDGGARP